MLVLESMDSTILFVEHQPLDNSVQQLMELPQVLPQLEHLLLQLEELVSVEVFGGQGLETLLEEYLLIPGQIFFHLRMDHGFRLFKQMVVFLELQHSHTILERIQE